MSRGLQETLVALPDSEHTTLDGQWF